MFVETNIAFSAATSNKTEMKRNFMNKYQCNIIKSHEIFYVLIKIIYYLNAFDCLPVCAYIQNH